MEEHEQYQKSASGMFAQAARIAAKYAVRYPSSIRLSVEEELLNIYGPTCAELIHNIAQFIGYMIELTDERIQGAKHDF